MKERKAYISLVALSVILSGLSIWFTIKEVNDNNQRWTAAIVESNHRWCELIRASLPAQPPLEPKNPKANPKEETFYKNYQIVLRLGEGLGCIK